LGKFAASIKRPKTRNALASGGLRPPDPLTKGSAPGLYWGLCPQTSVVGSRYRARHGGHAPRYCGLEPPLLVSETWKLIFRNCWTVQYMMYDMIMMNEFFCEKKIASLF